MYRNFLWILLMVIVACNNSTKEAQTVVNDEKENTVRQSGFDPAKAVDIIGAWLQQSAYFDKNTNHELDEDERQKTGHGLGFDYFLFKNDGSCLRDKNIRFDGTYDIIEKDGKRVLQIQTVPPGETYKYIIMGPVRDEMILYNSDVFLVYKKE